MKQLLFILFISISIVCYGHDTILLNTTQSLNNICIDDSSDNALIFFDDALLWQDTIECIPSDIIAELPDSLYTQRLQKLPFIIEVPYNEVVKHHILRYIKKAPRQVAILQRKAEYYFPFFENILAKHGLPYELCYMPIIESGLNPQAHSHMGAAGLWQFMPATGKKYGLEINSLVDERLDPIRSTEAACRFLKYLHNMFSDWSLVIAAYNCGPGNVNKAIHRANGKRDFWSIYPFLPTETRIYVPLFIAATYAMNYAQDHGICPANPLPTMATDTIITNKRQHLQQIADNLEIPLEELRRLNPQYTHDVIPGEKYYSICLPSHKTGLYIDNEETILAYQADELIHNRRAEIELLQCTSIQGGYSVNGVTYYKIQEGDTLGEIALKFRVSVKQLKDWNGLTSDMIRVGKTLKIGR